MKPKIFRAARGLMYAAMAGAMIVLTGCQAFNAATQPTATSEGLNATVAPLTELFPTTPTPVPTEAPIILAGAVTTDSGLQYLEEVAGTGASPQAGDIIVINFSAALADGTELVNTFKDGQPSTTLFGRDKLLPGWEEGVGLMKVGGKAKLVLPPALAFGADGNGSIPPNAQIVMEVELISTKAAPTPTNVSASDLTTTDSGLQYFDLQVGNGEIVTRTDTVTTTYTIWVQAEPALFIASSENSSEITFVVGKGDVVFPGWEEGVTGMRVGGKRLLIVPPALALGDQGGGDIPANATLILEVAVTGSHEARKAAVVNESEYVTTDSGLKYYDLVEGSGQTPQSGQTVEVHYTGWLEDGTQFDSSVDRGQTFSFVLGAGNVIPGWDEGVASMKVGGKRQLVIPASLGYGETGSGSVIPPNATLIFEVELISIQP